MESLHIDLDEDMMLRERADAITRAIGYYPLESGRYSNGDHLALISRIYPITLRPPAVICCQHYHQQRYSTVTAMLVTVTQIPAICPPSALCRNLKASLIRNKLQHHSFLLTVSSYQTLLHFPSTCGSLCIALPTSEDLMEKQIKCLERTTQKSCLSPPLNKCKMQKKNVVLPFPVQQIQKATPSFTMPFPQYCRPLAATGPRRRVPLW